MTGARAWRRTPAGSVTASVRFPPEWSVLGRLDWRRTAAFWRAALRDPVFDFAVLAGLAIGYFTLRRIWQVAQGQPVLALVLIAAAVGGLLMAQAYAGPGSKARRHLESGPFHLLVCAPGAMDRWMMARAVVAAGPVLGVAALVFASFDLLFGLGFAAAGVTGAAAWGAFTLMRPQPRPSAGRAAPDMARDPRPYRRRSPALVTAMAAQRRGPLPGLAAAVVLIALSAAAGALAARNNHSVAIGQYLAAAGVFLASTLLLPGGRLPGLLGQQPLGFLRLYVWLYAAPLAMAGSGGLAAGLMIGPGLAGGLQTASIALVAVFVLAWMHFLHRMIRSERNAGLSTGLEFVSALLMSAIEASLAPLWILARGMILVRAASRRRWLDR